MTVCVDEPVSVAAVPGARLRLSGVTPQSIVDGPGLRLVVFAQGCPHGCPGCHNPGTHAFDGGREWAVRDILDMLDRNPLLSGVTLSGGEPFSQAHALAALAEQVHARGKDVWCYSGYVFEELAGMALRNAGVRRLCSRIDVLVDGRFEEERRSLSLRFRGSSNQRILDMGESIRQNRAVSMRLHDWLQPA